MTVMVFFIEENSLSVMVGLLCLSSAISILFEIKKFAIAVSVASPETLFLSIKIDEHSALVSTSSGLMEIENLSAS